MQKVAAAALCATLLASIGLLIWSNTSLLDRERHTAAGQQDLVSLRCSMGSKFASSSKVNATIADYLSGVEAGTSVSRDEVGALIERITPDEIGVELFKVYTACLQTQTEAMLTEKGVVFEEDADFQFSNELEMAYQAISQISFYTPPERLVQIFGQPLAVAEGEGQSESKYQFLNEAYAIDYRTGTKRTALVIATSDSEYYFPELFEVRNMEETKHCSKDLMESSHRHTASGICPAHTGNGNIFKTYFFKSVEFDYVDNLRENGFNQSCLDPTEAITQAPDVCPNFMAAKPIAVGMAESEESLDDIRPSFVGELQYGSTFDWYDLGETDTQQK